MVNKTKKALSHPITFFVCLFLAIGSVVAFAIVKNINQSKADLISKVNIATITRDKETGKLVATIINDKQVQDEKYAYVDLLFNNAVNPEKIITDKIDTYISNRYNFTNGVSSITDTQKQAIERVSTSEFYKSATSKLSSDKAQTSKASIIKRFINGRGNGYIDSDVEMLVYDYVVEINGKQQVMRYEMKAEKGEWKLNSETFIAPIEGGNLW